MFDKISVAKRFKAALGLAAMVLAVGCGTVSSFDSRVVSPLPAPISEMSIQYVALQGVGATLASTTNLAKGEANRLTSEFDNLLEMGFKRWFSGTASRYGLAIVPSSANRLRVHIASVNSSCSGLCQSRATVLGTLSDAAGRPVWTFSMTFGQENAKADVNPDMFDKFAQRLLEAMRKDGLIGPSR